ncbi:hypothetical protein DFJ73DRAFT_306944 [Zopfochytrium polystomum]|nr:hypothetical protein DFJ73DRAFT_306944 [Zopfochytrium polystomum]
MAYDWGREVAEYAAMHAERSTCRRFVRLAFRDGCTDSRAPADDASGFKVGCDVAFLSPTVAHIVNAAERGGFVEHKTGIIYFSCNYAVLSQVVVFLYLRWLENACGKDMRVPDFTPLLPDILSIMDLAVYLDLPALVELCVLRVAENFAGRVRWKPSTDFPRH